VVDSAQKKKAGDLAGVLVFGSEAAIESRPNAQVDLAKIQAVVGAQRTDIASAIRLGTAAFPEPARSAWCFCPTATKRGRRHFRAHGGAPLG